MQISNCLTTRSQFSYTNIDSETISLPAKDEEVMYYDLVGKDFDDNETNRT